MFLPGIFGGVLCVAMRLCLFLLLVTGITHNKCFPGKFCNLDVNLFQTFIDTFLVLVNSFCLAHVISLSMMTAITTMAFIILLVALLTHGVKRMASGGRSARAPVKDLEEPLLWPATR